MSAAESWRIGVPPVTPEHVTWPHVPEGIPAKVTAWNHVTDEVIVEVDPETARMIDSGTLGGLSVRADPVPLADLTGPLMTDLMERSVQEHVARLDRDMAHMLAVIMDHLGVRQLILTPEELARVEPGITVVHDQLRNQVIISRTPPEYRS